MKEILLQGQMLSMGGVVAFDFKVGDDLEQTYMKDFISYMDIAC